MIEQVNPEKFSGDYNRARMIIPDQSLPIFCVIDTNVVLDIFYFADPAALPILEALQTGRMICWSDETILAELARVLTYPEFNLNANQAETIMYRFRSLIRLAAPESALPPTLPKCKDPDDQKFLELAARTGATLLISKDKALLVLAGKPGLTFHIAPPSRLGLQRTHDQLRLT